MGFSVACGQSKGIGKDGAMKKLFLLIGLAALAALIYVAAGPYLTMYRIEKSIAAQDLDGLSAQIDFPAVRADLKVQLQRKIDADTPDLLKKIPMLDSAVTTLSGKVLEQAIDPLMIGQLLYIMQGNHPDLDFGLGELLKPVPESTSTDRVFEHATTDYIDHQTFVATVNHAESGTYRFTFRRNGMHWKLSAVELPMLAVNSP